MASISKDPSGNRSIQFIGTDGKRRTIRLGKVPQRLAEEIKVKVEALAAAVKSGLSMDNETAGWVRKIGDDLAGKLAAVGLIPDRASAGSVQLGEFIDRYIAGRPDVKEGTRITWCVAGKRMKTFFGIDKSIRDITPGDADAFLIHLKTQDLAPATIGRTIKHARQFFRAAVRRKLINESPFADLKGPGQANAERSFFITREMALAVLEKCPDLYWRLIFALARWGGVRCPSEVYALKWVDVDWERSRFRVISPKTEHHEGKAERWVPIFPELRPVLEEAWEQAEEGAVYVVDHDRLHNGGQNLRTTLQKIIRRAGLKPWPRLFQNLRAPERPNWRPGSPFTSSQPGSGTAPR